MKDTFSKFLKILPLAILFALIVGVALWLLNHGEELFSDDGEAEEQAEAEVANRLPSARNAVNPGSVSRHVFENYRSETTSVEDDLELVQSLIRKFRLSARDQGSRYPMGTNREITRVLAGHNPVRRAWISPTHPAINASGELLDRWETPLHFHALSSSVFEIRSAGPDQRLFTVDDVVAGGSSRLSREIKTVANQP